jgi:hypothetical protein
LWAAQDTASGQQRLSLAARARVLALCMQGQSCTAAGSVFALHRDTKRCAHTGTNHPTISGRPSERRLNLSSLMARSRQPRSHHSMTTHVSDSCACAGPSSASLLAVLSASAKDASPAAAAADVSAGAPPASCSHLLARALRSAMVMVLMW